MKNTRLPAFRRRVLGLAVAACFAGAAYANPTGPGVAAGSATFATSGNTLTVTNAPGTVINWQAFSIRPDEVTRFVQSGAASAVLNRVTGGEHSAILGQLLSNGRVFLINPSGITIGAGARIDTAGFVASSLNLSDADFLAGRYRFTDPGNAGKVANAGTITAHSGGAVYLVAPTVENHGVVSAPNGDVMLAAGKSVELVAAASPHLRVQVQSGGEALNVGRLVAESGRVGLYGAAIRNAGTVSADSASVNAAGNVVLRASKDVTLDASSVVSASGPQGGAVHVQAEAGTLLVEGRVEAASSVGVGGEVKLLGSQVGIVGAASVDASGATGGGQVLVGGDYQGRNPDVQNAQATYVGAGAALGANATAAGDGGTVIVWADGATRFAGRASARGGARAGDGGFIEVSGKDYLEFTGTAETRAPQGRDGMLLLDPTNITISTAPTGSGNCPPAGPCFVLVGNPAAANLNVTDLANALANTNVTVNTASTGPSAGDITVQDAVTYTGAAARTLALTANRNIAVDAPIATTAGSLAVTMTAGGTGTVAINRSVTTRGGAVNVTGPGGVTSTLAGAIDTTGGNNQNGGAVTINAAGGAVNLSGAITTSGGTQVAAGAGRAAGAVTVNGTSTTVGPVTARGTNAVGGNNVGGSGGAVQLNANAAGGALLVSGAIDTRGGDSVGTGNTGSGGGVTLRAGNAGTVTTAAGGTITTTGGLGQTGGGVTATGTAAGNTLAGATLQGAITTNGGNATTVGKNAGTLTVTQAEAVTIAAPVTARGSNAATGNNVGGNGGQVLVDARDLAMTPGVLPSIQVNAAIDTRGGDSVGSGNTGNGGLVRLRTTNGGAISSTAAGTIVNTGGRGQTGGGVTIAGIAAGDTVTTVNLQGAITTSGGIGTLAGAGGKDAGALSITQAEAVTLGAVTARGTDSTSGAGAAGGRGGGVTVTVRNDAGTPAAPSIALTGPIDTRGGNSTGAVNGNAGGAVQLRASAGATVTSTSAATVDTSGGRGQTGGVFSVTSTPAADTLAAINLAGAITTSGGAGSTNAVGLNAGAVTINNASATTVGAIAARGGLSGGGNAVGGSGGTINLAARNGAAAIQLNGAIDTRGGDSAGTGNTGTGGVVAIATGTANGSIAGTAAATIDTTGGRGQTGGNVSVTTTGAGTIALQGAITTSGGTPATGLGGKNAGTVTVGAATTTTTRVAAITAAGGNAAAGVGGAGGAVVVRGVSGVTLGGNIATTGGTGVTTGGAGGLASVTGPTTLATDVTIDSRGGAGAPAGAGGAVTFAATSTIDSDATARALTVTSGTGAVTLGAAVGATNALATTTVNGGAVSVRGVRTTGAQAYAGTGVTLNGTLQSTGAGAVAVNGPVTLAGASAVQTAGNAGDNVAFSSTINGAQSLTVNAGAAGNASFGGGIGQTTALTSLGVTAAAVTLPATRTGTLAVTTSGGAIGQTGAIVATGTSSLNAGAGNVVLTNAANDFGGAVSVTAAGADLRDANALVLGASTVAGNLGLTAGGAITQTGAVSAGGTTTIAAGANAITLTNAANNFGTVAVTSGGNVSIADANALTVGASSLGTLSARALGGNLTLGGNVTATGAGDAIVLSAAGGNFLNPGGFTLAPGTGRWLIYSGNPAATTLGALAPGFKRYNCTLAGGCLTPGTTVPGAGNGILYSIAPTLNVNANAVSIEYGSAPAALTYSSSGFIDGDVAATALAGSLARTAGPLSTSGNEVAGVTAITQGTVASPLGYQVSYTGANYSITRKALAAGLTGTVTKAYDATPAATLAPANYTLSGAIAGDVVTLNNPAAGAFDTPNAGAGKTVSVGGLALAGADAGNYTVNATANAAIGAITPATLTYVANAANRAYGDTNPALGGSVTGFQGADTLPTATTGALAFTTPAVVTSPVGSYAIDGGGLAANNGNYVFVQAPGNATALTIAPRPITLTAGSAARAYGDPNPVPAPLYTVGGSGMANAEDAQALFGFTVASGAVANTPVGAYAAGPNAYNVAGVGAGVNGNYNITAINPGTLTIGQRAITVTADPGQSKIYGEANPVAYAYSLTSGSLVAGDAFAGATTRAAGENVGNYAIQQGTLTAGGNYALGFVSNDFGITARPITITANAGQTKVYGGLDPAFAYVVTGGAGTTGPAIVAGDALVGALARAPGENVGPYPINPGTLAPNAPANYAVTFVPANFTITPAVLNVTANAQTKVYGTPDPALTYGATGFQFTDTPASVLSGGLVRVPGETVPGGPYAINQGTLASNANYTIAYTGANLTITPAALTIAANNATRPYGDPNPALTATFTGLAGGDTSAAIPGVSLATTAVPASNVGLYPINVTSGANPNYTIAYVNGQFTVLPAPLTIAANDATRRFGQPNPPFTSVATGFKLGQSLGDLNGTLLLLTPATATSPAGRYAIVPSGASSPNYAVTFVDGTLLVTQAAPPADQALVAALDRGAADTPADVQRAVVRALGCLVLERPGERRTLGRCY